MDKNNVQPETAPTEPEDNLNEGQPELALMKLEANIRPVNPTGNLIAFASIKINNCFVVEGVKLLNGENGLHIGMPSAPDGKGGYRDICFPVTSEFREQITETVIAAYDVAVEGMWSMLDAAEKYRKVNPKNTVHYDESGK